MFPTPKPLAPVNSDAGISGEVTSSQTPGVPIAGGSVLPPQPTTTARASGPRTTSLFMGCPAARRTPRFTYLVVAHLFGRETSPARVWRNVVAPHQPRA